MAEKIYDWANGAELPNHTRCKLDILREYFAQYLRVKCSPMVRHFRIAIVDGFAGGGIYKDGTVGSPLIFLEELKLFFIENTIKRDKILPKLSIECLFIVNEDDPEANESLYKQLQLWEQDNDIPKEHFNVKIQKLQKPFLDVYPEIRQTLWNRKFQNVLFNIDPCGYTDFNLTTLQDIMKSFKNVEVFYTCMIGALLQYTTKQKGDGRASRDSIEENIKKLLDVPLENFLEDKSLWKKPHWLGAAERIVHKKLSNTADFVSPFAINQEGNVGYNYWLLHFANNYRAREVYNDVLHGNARGAAHFGKSGLKMLEYTPEEKNVGLFNFSKDSTEMRTKSKEELRFDIPEFMSKFRDGMSVGDFRNAIYNDTPAHSDDINSVLIENPDIALLTHNKHPRRSENSIMNTDFIMPNKQKSFHIYLETKPVSHKKLSESLNATREKDQPVLDYLKDK